jgi:hypothetical protein
MRTGRYLIATVFIPALVLGLTLGLLCLLNGRSPIRAAPVAPLADELRVCLSGCIYTSVQAAVDAAGDGDMIKVATGVYTDIHMREGITQVVYISNSVTLRGGYTTTNWTISDPEAYPTTLDAQRQGRVLYITGEISLTVEGLRITGGNVISNSGGGIYNEGADLTLINAIVTSNTVSGVWPNGFGGGVYVRSGSATLNGGGQIINNSAETKGGGMFVWEGNVKLSGGQIISNSADNGGGVYTRYGSVTLSEGQIVSNSANNQGGGIYTYHGNVTLEGGQILSNTAQHGGGIFIWSDNTTLSGGQIANNSALTGGGVYVSNSAAFTQTGASIIVRNKASHGGGVYAGGESNVTLNGGQIINNSAVNYGGGVYAFNATVTVRDSQILHNTADSGAGLYLRERDAMLEGNTVAFNIANDDGGGLFLWRSDTTLINNIIADNQISGIGKGSGLYIGSSSPRLLHNTIARNSGGDGSGVHVTIDDSTYSNAILTNTILVSHTMGITVTAGNTATLEATLWGTDNWANLIDWGGTGKIITGSANIWGDPAFVDPATDDYHITFGSAAVDAGVNAGVSTDIDGQVRPVGAAYDIGADEWGVSTIYLPLVLRRWPPVPDLFPIDNTDGDGDYDVCWSEVGRANYYVLEEAIYCDFNGWKGVYTGTDTCYSITDKGPTRYYYRVKARNGWPDDVWSNVQSVDVLWEKEPNDDPLSQANGPIVSGLTYYGTFPSGLDVKDYFSFTLTIPHSVEIWLTNIPAGHDYHLCLRDANLVPEIRCSANPGNADEHILVSDLTAGKRYYIQVFNASQTGSSQPYHLHVRYQTEQSLRYPWKR